MIIRQTIFQFCTMALCGAFALVAPKANAAQSAGPTMLRVLSYNINALPSPIRKHKTSRLNRIAQILKERRANGTQPDIVVLQEAFGKRCDVIIEQSGYKYVVRGPGRKTGKRREAASWNIEGKHSYTKRAMPQKFLGSGLIILSDFEIKNPVFSIFDGDACAGLDCLANKAIVMVEISVPGMDTPVHLVTTHFNSNRSAKVPGPLRMRAHQTQTDILAKFLARTSTLDSPLILAGDFNTKQTPRYQYFRDEINALDAAEICLEIGLNCVLGGETKVEEILYHSDDKQFYRSSDAILLTPVYIERNFRETVEGQLLSDHTGYEVHYTFSSKNNAGN